MMRNKKLYDSTNVVIASISQLHSVSPSRENAAKVTRLVTAMVDIIEAQEEVNSSLQEQLKKERQWRLRIEKRIEELESQIHRSLQHGVVGVGSPESKNVHASQSLSPQVLSQTVNREAHLVGTENSPVYQEGAKNLRQLAEGIPMRQGEHRVKSTGGRQSGHQFLKQDFKEVREIVTTATSKVKAPFTRADVEQMGSTRRKKRRNEQNFQPPPCDKCRLHRRALMQKKHGYVKEDVFERWANRPGGCFHFIHYDEELPENHPRSQLSFAETETQDPGEIK